MTLTLVTGANRGLGYETARRLSELGHTVLIGARDQLRGSQAAHELGATFIEIDRPTMQALPNHHKPGRSRCTSDFQLRLRGSFGSRSQRSTTGAPRRSAPAGLVGGIPLVPSASGRTPSTWWTAIAPSSKPLADAVIAQYAPEDLVVLNELGLARRFLASGLDIEGDMYRAPLSSWNVQTGPRLEPSQIISPPYPCPYVDSRSRKK